mmetsp:Transcript_21181/g.21301  ORF Transcript_21181/g.21301 Transcript_21181/m.21301 type:complete len:190 (+) Transcript_21181:67-636(+)|eukprot:CAMPEP_0182425820 /NCGR_PEP_ID=MMETSP1167-20130531/12307_1 /TAXON_ID=2988 /ORGANISM="Mallomonas Sp, Strain CCMP3275" /LENGTH=189 /DNA_ID=CAMNT_0024606827 /DNA_START=50 /DNA_END=619 /DNA_ORIENTATION=-
MVRYSREPENATKAAKARASHIRVHYKHCREISKAIKGLNLLKAKKYLENVLKFKAAIPFTKYTGGIGRHSLGKQYNAPGDKVGWPIKATKVILDLLRNVESNAETKGLDLEQVVLTHVQSNQAPKMRRRTYRAHGRINPYMSCPAHIELFAEEKAVEVPKAKEPVKMKMTKKRLAQARAIKAGGGVEA